MIFPAKAGLYLDHILPSKAAVRKSPSKHFRGRHSERIEHTLPTAKCPAMDMKEKLVAALDLRDVNRPSISNPVVIQLEKDSSV